MNKNSLCFLPRVRHHKNRRGVTLIEMMATLGVLMGLGVASAKLLTSVTEIGLETGDQKVGRATIQRLAADFRQDVASAEALTITDDAATTEIQFGDTQVLYQIVAGQSVIDRVATQDDQVVSRERFKLTKRCTPSFSMDGKLVRLQLTSPDERNPWTIEAVKP